jgi:hypothetical protein
MAEDKSKDRTVRLRLVGLEENVEPAADMLVITLERAGYQVIERSRVLPMTTPDLADHKRIYIVAYK